MSKHTGGTDHTNLVRLEPEITRAYWSRVRAWNGTDVTLYIETRWVPDDAPVTLEIFEDNSEDGSEDGLIETLPAGRKVVGNRCAVRHTLRWDAAKLGSRRAAEGHELEFYFLVTLARFSLCARSNLLYVDLGGLAVSR